MSNSRFPRFLYAGESALVVEYGDRIDPEIHDKVLALDSAIGVAAIPGIIETVPTYRSLMIEYDPERLSPDALIEWLRNLPVTAAESRKVQRRWAVPACYAPRLALDLAFISESLGLTTAKVVELHSGAVYRIYMYGFAPGFAYLGGLPRALDISRRAEPRARVPANCLLIAGGQALISTVPMPTGWHVVGRTPERFFSLGRDPIFLAAVGDEVTFEAVDEATFTRLETRAAAGEPIARLIESRQ
jgi:inhibitor of KinA